MADKDPEVRVVDRRWWARDEKTGDSDRAASTKPTYVEELEQRVAELTTELQGYSGDHKRALEEFEATRLRMRRDIGREVERGKRAVLVELLEVVDNLDRAIAASRASTKASEGLETVVRGVELVRDQFLSKLQAFGVARVPSLHQPFDASRHEAVTTTAVADPAADGMVVAVISEGYAIGDDLLRPASVVVGRHDA